MEEERIFIDIEGSQPDFEKCVAKLVNHEVPRKVYEVQAIKHRRSITEDPNQERDRKKRPISHVYNARATRKEEREEKKRAETAAIYEMICGG